VRNDWLEEALIAWGQWRSMIGPAGSWGGAGRALGSIGLSKPASSHSRLLSQRGCDSALVNYLLTAFAARDRHVMLKRYVGEQVAVPTTQIIHIGADNAAVAPLQIEVHVPFLTDYTGKLPYARVAALAGISESAVARIVTRVKQDLRRQIGLLARERSNRSTNLQMHS